MHIEKSYVKSLLLCAGVYPDKGRGVQNCHYLNTKKPVPGVKKSAFLLLFLTQLKIVQGQDSAGRVLLSAGKQLFYVELNGEQGTLFSLGRWLDIAGRGYSIIYTDTITKQAGTSEFLFAGDKTTIQQAGNKLYLVAPQRKGTKKMEIDTTTNTILINTNINNAYWWDNFLKLCNDINSTFKMHHYSFHNGFALWKSFDNKSIYYKDFRVFADNRIKMLKDSIVAAQTPYVLLTNEIIKNIATIDYASLKDSVSKLSEIVSKLSAGNVYKSAYFGTVINSICNNRPELFFKLAEDMPGKREMLFDAVSDKETLKKLEATATNSAVKKEFFKAKKRDKAFTVKMIGAAAAGAAVLGTCLYVLLFK